VHDHTAHLGGEPLGQRGLARPTASVDPDESEAAGGQRTDDVVEHGEILPRTKITVQCLQADTIPSRSTASILPTN
jgi:hypothetical protein